MSIYFICNNIDICAVLHTTFNQTVNTVFWLCTLLLNLNVSFGAASMKSNFSQVHD